MLSEANSAYTFNKATNKPRYKSFKTQFHVSKSEQSKPNGYYKIQAYKKLHSYDYDSYHTRQSPISATFGPIDHQ